MDIKKSMSCKNAKFFKIRFLDCPDKIKKKKKSNERGQWSANY